MTVKNRIKTALIGFAVWIFLLIGMGQNFAIADPMEPRTIDQERMQILDEPVNLESGVDRFLTSLPSGYYTISNVEELKSQLENPKTVLVDVRESAEYRVGHIPNAINIPLRTLTKNLDKIPSDRPVILYCSSGYRSAMGVMTLHLLGYGNIKGFPPSFAGWQAAGEEIFPLHKDG